MDSGGADWGGIAPLGIVPAGHVMFDEFVPGACCDDPAVVGAFAGADGAGVVEDLVLAAF